MFAQRTCNGSSSEEFSSFLALLEMSAVANLHQCVRSFLSSTHQTVKTRQAHLPFLYRSPPANLVGPAGGTSNLQAGHAQACSSRRRGAAEQSTEPLSQAACHRAERVRELEWLSGEAGLTIFFNSQGKQCKGMCIFN
eukprot:1137107-Pelagomonas_calceolata.AAC.12